MSREFEVTEGMRKATWYIAPEPTETEVFRAMTAHPDFRAQLRKWAAEEMRGLVATTYTGSHPSALDEYESGHYDACAETLANIERWEKQP